MAENDDMFPSAGSPCCDDTSAAKAAADDAPCCGSAIPATTEKVAEGASDEQVRQTVREAYGRVAESPSASCCGPTDCCGSLQDVGKYAEKIGYSKTDLEGLPEGANLGLGCGNPTALAGLKEGETVIDLGAGAGFDAFIAARQVGPTGRVIGIDMTPQMLERARQNAVKAEVASYVEFREGTIEQLPVVNDSVDVILSNCVINLSPDKPQVFREAFRVLKPGGRLAVSDIVLSEPLPEDVARIAAVYVACVGGASTEAEYIGAMKAAGFENIEFTRVPAAELLQGALTDPMAQSAIQELGMDRIMSVANNVFSYKIEARKP